jgi:hypothetical protein
VIEETTSNDKPKSKMIWTSVKARPKKILIWGTTVSPRWILFLLIHVSSSIELT